MSQNCCNQPPAVLECGDTVTVTEAFTSYPATEWTMAMALSLIGSTAVNNSTAATISGTGSASNWSFNLTSAITANLSPGNFFYAFYATQIADNTIRKTAKTGGLAFIPSLTAAQTPSIAQQQLTALNTTILSLSASGNQSCSFNGQSFTKRDMAQLMAMRRELEAQVFREGRAAANLRGVVDTGNISPRFVGSGCGPYPYYWGIGGGCC